ncbi:hypothetical protein F4825DRAFT_440756 [Nemania diffusa]|nr:hypothetical protein F4825DRAFT_440756 [Nemania diffusa]
MMVPLADFILAIERGFSVAVTHSMMLWPGGGWAALATQFAYLASGYSLAFYALKTWLPHRIVNISPANVCLAWISVFALQVFGNIVNLRIADRVAPWISDAWSSVSRMISEFIPFCSVFGGMSPRHMLSGVISFFAQPHAMNIVHQMITMTIVLWLVIRPLLTFLGNRIQGTTDNEARPADKRCIECTPEGKGIYRRVNVIMENSNGHWKKFQGRFPGRACQLEEGASPEQIQSLDQLLGVTLPEDYKLFLRHTNGLDNVLDGGFAHLTFMSTENAKWLEDIYHWPCLRTQDLWATWFIESMFGRGTRKELAEQVAGKSNIRHRTRFIKIASRATTSGGVFLVPPGDCRSIAREWVRSALEDEGRCGALIGRIDHHGQTYFSKSGRPLVLLQNWEKWLVLQVDEGGKHCRLYPHFTALLQTLAEVSDRPTKELFVNGICESTYAEFCISKWEGVWNCAVEDAWEVWKRGA